MTQRTAVLGSHDLGTASLPSLVRHYAAERPQAPAIVTADAPPISYGDLAERIDTMGRLLRQAGIGREGHIAILLPSGGALASVLVSLFSHAIAVPLDPRLTDEEFEDLCARVRLDAILTDRSDRLPADRPARRIALEEFGQRLELCVYGKPGGPAEDRVETLDSLAMILRTSGTTAQPKLVPLTHGNMVARGRVQQRCLGLTAEDRAFCVAPLLYAHGLETALWASLAVGGSLACPPPSDQVGQAGDILTWLSELEPTYYSAGPTFHRLMLDHALAQGGKPHHRLRLIQSAGAPLPERERQAMEAAFGVPMLDAYGSSETGQMAGNGWAAAERRAGTVGRPFDDTVALCGEDGALLQRGVEGESASGEIVARGPTVIPGYFGDGGRLLSVVKDGWFHTGDLGTIDADGFLTVTGRLKDIVNRGGEKIAPAEVDQVLLRHPEVAEAAAFPVPHPRLGEDLAAAVVLRPDATVTPLDLRRYLNERLVPFKVPRRIHLLPQLPKGATGKVSRASLTEQLSAQPQQDTGILASALEHEIVTLWARLLGRDSVAPTADFFELGGDSLLAVEMRLALERLIGRKVPPRLLFEAATARQLVDAIVADDDGGGDSELVPLRTEGQKQPLIFFDGDLTGGGYYMRRIAAQLEPDRPLYLLRPFDLTKGRLPTIETMASQYLSLLRQAGFRPPFIFGGHCNGALIALEAARQAEAAGDAVSLVIMVDPISLNARRTLRGLLRTLTLFSRVRSSKERKRQEMLDRAMTSVWTVIEGWGKRRQNETPSTEAISGVDDTGLAFGPQSEQRIWIYRQAMASFLPRRVAAKLVCLTATRSLPRLFDAAPWSRFSGDFETATVPGGHLTCLTDGAEALAAKMRAALAPL